MTGVKIPKGWPVLYLPCTGRIGIPFGGGWETIVMLTVILLLAGLVCFGLFFKSIDFFEKI
jgi:hypothetical protein